VTAPWAGFAPIVLATDAEIPQRRAELAREIFGRQILRVDVEPMEGEFRTDLTLRGLPGLKLITGWANDVTVERSPTLLADGNDDIMFGFGGAQGRLVTEQRGEQVVLERGYARAFHNAERFTLKHLASTAPGMMVPRKALAALVPDLEDRIARPIPRFPNGLSLLQGYVDALAAMPSLASPGAAETAVTHIHDLLAYIIGPSRDAAEVIAARGLKAARLRAIKAHIARSLRGPDLSLDAIAATHRVSPRYLQRLFEGEGTSFSAYVIDLRLDYARRLLGDSRVVDRRISSIAYECGFRDVSHFNRLFRRRYGLTPSDVRNEASSGGR
jgi:AraC-like DNA-binding protein